MVHIDGDHAETNSYYQQGGYHLSAEEHLSVEERAMPHRSKRVQNIMNHQHMDNGYSREEYGGGCKMQGPRKRLTAQQHE